MREAAGICWMRTGTVGHLTRSSDRLLGVFSGEQGADGVLAYLDARRGGKARACPSCESAIPLHAFRACMI